MRYLIALIVLLILTGNPAYFCEFGRTYKDHNLNGTEGRPSGDEIIWSVESGLACYVDPKHRVFSKYPPICTFDESGMIRISTGYTWCGMENPPPKGKEPYVVYKGHRWYPNYHGTIYVYKELKRLNDEI